MPNHYPKQKILIHPLITADNLFKCFAKDSDCICQKATFSTLFVGQAVPRVRNGLMMGHFQVPCVAKLL